MGGGNVGLGEGGVLLGVAEGFGDLLAVGVGLAELGGTVGVAEALVATAVLGATGLAELATAEGLELLGAAELTAIVGALDEGAGCAFVVVSCVQPDIKAARAAMPAITILRL